MRLRTIARSGGALAWLLAAALACSDGNKDGGDGDTGDTGGDDGGDDGDGSDTGDGGTGTGGDGGDDPGPDDVGEIPECNKPEVECEALNEGEDCDSGYCHAFSSVPLDPDAACQDAPPFGELRLTGEVRRWEDSELLPGVDVTIAPALPTAMDPTNLVELATGTTDADARFDVTTTMANEYGIGMVAVVGGEGTPYYLTGTGMVEPKLGSTEYPAGARNHNVWVQEESTLTAWSEILAEDPEMEPFMPLGEQGGVIGRIWDDCANPVGGVSVVSWLGDDSTALVRYLNADEQTFNKTATSKNGLFVIVYPILPEKFDAYYEGEKVNEVEGTVGNTFGAIFTVTISVTIPQ